MGTKNNPGKYDCYANAKPDQPMFILLAGDELAPHLVAIWAALSHQDVMSATHNFAELLGMAFKLEPRTEDKCKDAYKCAADMIIYALSNAALHKKDLK